MKGLPCASGAVVCCGGPIELGGGFPMWKDDICCRNGAAGEAVSFSSCCIHFFMAFCSSTSRMACKLLSNPPALRWLSPSTIWAGPSWCGWYMLSFLILPPLQSSASCLPIQCVNKLLCLQFSLSFPSLPSSASAQWFPPHTPPLYSLPLSSLASQSFLSASTSSSYHLSAVLSACKKFKNCSFLASLLEDPMRQKNDRRKSLVFSSSLSLWKGLTYLFDIFTLVWTR